MKIKHQIELVICFFSKHDFTTPPGYGQQVDCRRCHQPYAETLRDKWQRLIQKSVENP